MSDLGELGALRQQAESDAATLLRQAKTESQQLVAAARREAEFARMSAEQTAEAIVAHAQQQAATIAERARQELFWCRRQLRRERAVLARRTRAVVNQLASLQVFAAETVMTLYAEPQITFDEDLSSDTAGPTEVSDLAQAGRG